MTRALDTTPLFYPPSLTSLATCRICGQTRTESGEQAHAERHLSVCEAIVDNGRVVPTKDVPWPAKDGPAPDGGTLVPTMRTRRIDPELRRIARAALKRAKGEA